MLNVSVPGCVCGSAASVLLVSVVPKLHPMPPSTVQLAFGFCSHRNEKAMQRRNNVHDRGAGNHNIHEQTLVTADLSLGWRDGWHRQHFRCLTQQSHLGCEAL